jgi:uncharacterized protein (TIGR00251 family)
MDQNINIMVKVKAGAKKDEVISYDQQDDGNYILKLSVKQVPENGKANDAVIKLLAKTFDIKRSDIEIISGFTNNRKIIRILAAKMQGEVFVEKLGRLRL